MDSIIPIGQKNTLAEYMILSGVDNRPPMLDKDLYDSWKSIMELYMQNRENGRMILESFEHGPLIWPTIEENGVTKTKKYAELSATEKIQADCDLKATNIILQGLPSDIYSLVNHHRVAKDLWENLPPEWSKFVTDVKLVKDLHTTNFDQLHAYLENHELHANEVRLMRERTKNSSNPRQQATIHDRRVTVQPLHGRQNSYVAGTSGTRTNTSGTGGDYSGQQRVVKCFNCQGEGHMARQCPKPKRKRDATWFRDTVILVEAQENGKVLNEEELEFLADLDITEAKAVLMANLSSYRSNVLSEVPISNNTNNDILNQSVQEMPYSEPSHFVEHPENEIHSDSNIIPYSQYLIESQNAVVQDTNSTAQQDAFILFVFEQLSNQVTNCNKVNNDNLIVNESLSTEFERYKERAKLLEERQNVDLGTREKLIIDDIIREKNAHLKQALAFQNHFYLKKAQQIRTMLYDGNVIAKEPNVISISNSEETLMLEEESRSKIILKQTLHPNTDQSASSAVKIEAPRELHMISLVNTSLKKLNYHLGQFDNMVKKRITPDALTEGEWYFVDKQCFEIQKKQFLIENDRLLDQIISQDIVNIVVNSSVDMNIYVNVNSPVAVNDSVNYIEKLIHNSMIQLNNHVFCAKDMLKLLVNQLNQKSVEITDLNAQLQEKVVVITSLENDLRKLKGKNIVDNAAQVSNATTIALGMYKLDPVTLAPKDKINRETPHRLP
ncbi:retrovirus-related pol polyprotein from transposon TNT 1-94 [Tanacetum coccineum]